MIETENICGSYVDSFPKTFQRISVATMMQAHCDLIVQSNIQVLEKPLAIVKLMADSCEAIKRINLQAI